MAPLEATINQLTMPNLLSSSLWAGLIHSNSKWWHPCLITDSSERPSPHSKLHLNSHIRKLHNHRISSSLLNKNSNLSLQIWLLRARISSNSSKITFSKCCRQEWSSNNSTCLCSRINSKFHLNSHLANQFLHKSLHLLASKLYQWDHQCSSNRTLQGFRHSHSSPLTLNRSKEINQTITSKS